MDLQQLNQIKKDLTDSVGLLEQMTVQGQKNVYITFNIFGFLNAAIQEIQTEIEKQQNETK